jgi:hypothetical protein
MDGRNLFLAPESQGDVEGDVASLQKVTNGKSENRREINREREEDGPESRREMQEH